MFCDLPRDRELASTVHVVAFADANPVTAGHVLLVPRRHVADPLGLSDVEALHVHRLARQVAATARESDPTIVGFTYGANCGTAAGQTIGHAHTHLIPRRAGDTPDPTGGVRGVVAGKAHWPGWDGGADR